MVGVSVLAAGVLLIGGCSSQSAVPRHGNGYIVGVQGSGPEVVFPGVALAGAVSVGDEYARRDEALAYREPGTAFDADAWPAAPTPTLFDARYLYLPRQSERVLYFGTSFSGSYPSYGAYGGYGSRYRYQSWY